MPSVRSILRLKRRACKEEHCCLSLIAYLDVSRCLLLARYSPTEKKATPTFLHVHMRNLLTRSFSSVDAVYVPERRSPSVVRASIKPWTIIH